jgi:hypothetical protein
VFWGGFLGGLAGAGLGFALFLVGLRADETLLFCLALGSGLGALLMILRTGKRDVLRGVLGGVLGGGLAALALYGVGLAVLGDWRWAPPPALWFVGTGCASGFFGAGVVKLLLIVGQDGPFRRAAPRGPR